jgi:hypothetical protein
MMRCHHSIVTTASSKIVQHIGSIDHVDGADQHSNSASAHARGECHRHRHSHCHDRHCTRHEKIIAQAKSNILTSVKEKKQL